MLPVTFQPLNDDTADGHLIAFRNKTWIIVSKGINRRQNIIANKIGDAI